MADSDTGFLMIVYGTPRSQASIYKGAFSKSNSPATLAHDFTCKPGMEGKIGLLDTITMTHGSGGSSTTDRNRHFGLAYSATAFAFGAVIAPECQRRLKKLETFAGDNDLGFQKPELRAIEAIRHLLSAMYSEFPNLESPVISPVADGEIIVSWRRADRFLTCHFEKDEHFDWVFKQTRMISGSASAADRDTQSGLAQVVCILLGSNPYLASTRTPVEEALVWCGGFVNEISAF